MTRLQAALLVVLVLLASVLAGRLAWSVLEDGTVVVDHVILLAGSVPEWAWWTAFGAMWWLPCALGKRSWSCGTTSPSTLTDPTDA